MDWKTISLKDLAGVISNALQKAKIDATLVGGACVTIYSNDQYQSYDLDFISYEEMKKIKKVLNDLGFHEKKGYFKHPKCPFLIEFVSPPIAVGHEPVNQFNKVKTTYGTIKLLRPIDSVKDRLASYFYWNDDEALTQALQISEKHHIDLKELDSWAKRENQQEKYLNYKALLKKKS